jgi:type IV pilus assembly protein PilW
LVRYDLLRFTNDTSQNPVPLADGVVDMRVMYGVDNAPANGTVDQWVAPTGAFSPTSLSNGTAAAQTTLARILAVKVSMVVRSELIEKDDIAPATVSMFPSLDATQRVAYTVTAANRKRRHRVLEFTVPIRNVITMSGRPTPP